MIIHHGISHHPGNGSLDAFDPLRLSTPILDIFGPLLDLTRAWAAVPRRHGSSIARITSRSALLPCPSDYEGRGPEALTSTISPT